MTKELEALNILRDNHIQFTKEKYGKLDKEKLQNIIKHKLARWNILEQALKRNEPMKPKISAGKFCPVCNCTLDIPQLIEVNFCPKCGQKLDWSDEIEKEKENK